MSSVTPIEDKKERTAANAYDEVSLKLERLESITVLIRAADSSRIGPEELPSVGYTLEHMVEDIGVGSVRPSCGRPLLNGLHKQSTSRTGLACIIINNERKAARTRRL